MNTKQLPSYTSALYYLILALVVTGTIWAYVMPIELTIPGRGYISFLGDPQAVYAPEDGVVQSLYLKSVKSVEKQQNILAYQMVTMNTAAELKSPADGVLIWQRDLIPGDMMKSGERIGLIYPPSPVGVEVHLQERDLGRVQPGMPVRIKLDAYPFQNYGVIRGVVREQVVQHTSVPGREMQIMVQILLDEVPDKRIILRPGLSANIEIITGKTRLLQKIFS